MTFLSISLAFGLLAVLHLVFDSRFKLCAFCCQWSPQGGRVEKLSGQYFSLICDESLTCRDLNLNPGHFGSLTFISCFVWRITFVCLVVSRW
jgi:hypothetical protein